ncbi:nitroreductase family protein [Tepidibacter hydrothermalis]|uniref:Nitroreductase family protein n=1 Tax=Tepidibacter hydrothermalis TaxID=3036126 RepID=A0ABY8EHL5_9FIRM|nr:nitroreductase family protein [Tepidibacter hydrothermalis]WFD12408.1 nitroreductase family protein [Tepidibacter hydrothermalis]
MKGIIERRSIRKYTEEKISDEKIKEILKAGMYAPSGGNAQPWDFVVIKDKKLLTEITKVHSYSHSLKEADCGIIVCGNLKKEKFKDLWIQDCSAATQNILLAAHSLGLGSVWLGLYPEMDRVDGVRDIINAPENIIPFSIISLGYPAEKKSIPDRYDESNIHYEQW